MLFLNENNKFFSNNDDVLTSFNKVKNILKLETVFFLESRYILNEGFFSTILKKN
jgi:hypothetical protein